MVAYGVWRWPAVLSSPSLVLFFLLDLIFVSANVHKIPAGGWSLLLGLVALTLCSVWRKVAHRLRTADQNAIGLTTSSPVLIDPARPSV